MSTLLEKLNQIRAGILTEADDDKYDISPDKPADEPDTDKSANPDTSTPEEPDTTDKPVTKSDDDSYDLPTGGDDEGADGEGNITDEDPDEVTGDEPATSDNVDDNGETVPEEAGPKPGEFISLDTSSRKILTFKNFKEYRSLRDSVTQIISDLSQVPSFSDVNRGILKMALEKATALESKLNDYILYKYTDNSYEINFKNFSDFIIEKRLILDIIETVNNTTKK